MLSEENEGPGRQEPVRTGLLCRREPAAILRAAEKTVLRARLCLQPRKSSSLPKYFPQIKTDSKTCSAFTPAVFPTGD